MNDEIYNALKNCNSEIRVQPIRYAVKGCDFMALCVIEATSDKPFEVFDDMVGGDIEYSDAETFLTSEKEKKKHGFGFSYGRDIYDAIKKQHPDWDIGLDHIEGCPRNQLLPNVPIDECSCNCYEKILFRKGYYAAKGTVTNNQGEPK